MAIDLNSYSLKELKELQNQVTKAISSFEDRKKKEALARLEQAAQELGYSLSDLTGAVTGRKRAVATPKYANPANPAETWTGRGRKPRWFIEATDAGKSPDDLLI